MADQYQDLYGEDDRWGSYYSREYQGPTYFADRSRSKSLHAWQNKHIQAQCHLMFGESLKSISVLRTTSGDTRQRLDFSIEGGSEYPRLVLTLHLITKDKPSIIMIAIFPAWGTRNIDNNKWSAAPDVGQPLNLPDMSSLEEMPTFTFSDSMYDLAFAYTQIPPIIKQRIGMTDSDKHYTVIWHSSVQPICINFEANLSRLSPDQQKAANLFRSIKRTNNACRATLMPKAGSLGAQLAYLVNMPNPTPPPWPRYSSSFDRAKHHLMPLYVRDILLLQGSEPGRQFAERKTGWQNMSSARFNDQVVHRRNGDVLFLPFPVRGQASPAQSGVRGDPKGFFLSERDYEVSKIVGLARDVHFKQIAKQGMFDKFHDFDLLPAGQTEVQGNVVVNDFYIFLNVRPTNNFGDNSLPPPAPGTRVKIRIADASAQQAAGRARQEPMMAIDQSGHTKSISKYRYDFIGSRIAGPGTVKYPRASPRSGFAMPIQQSYRGSQVGSPTYVRSPESPLSPATEFQNLAIVASSSAQDPTPLNKREERVWYGVVVPRSGTQHDEMNICVFVSIAETGMGMGLQNCRGHFSFGNNDVSYVQSEQAVHLAMYGEATFYRIPQHSEANWVKRLLLGHENASMASGEFGRDHSDPNYPAPPPLHPLTSQQDQFFRRAISSTHNNVLNSKLAMMQGPPGTGKTRVAAAIAHHSYMRKETLLVSAGSNYAVNNVAEAIFELLRAGRPTSLHWKTNKGEPLQTRIEAQAENGIWGIYRLETEADEHFSNFEQNVLSKERPTIIQELNDNDEVPFSLKQSEFNNPIVGSRISDEEYQSLENWINLRATTNRKLSLGDHIKARLSKARRERSNWSLDWSQANEEQVHLWYFMTQRFMLSRLGYTYADLIGSTQAERSARDEEMSREAKNLERSSLSAWRSLQKFYLRYACVVLVTASTAGRKVLSHFRANRVLIDEAAQLTEIDALNALIRQYSNLWKIVLIGDRSQLPPVIVSKDDNEMVEEHSRSLMARMQDSGAPIFTLTEQRRMHPDISMFPSQAFYNGRLTDHPTVQHRRPAIRFQDILVGFFSKINHKVNKSSLYFVSCTGPHIYYRKGCTSFMNPGVLSRIMDMFQEMYPRLKGKHEDGKPITFAILAYYAEEVALLQRWAYKTFGADEEAVTVTSIDASQGREFDYVLLSTCRPGGRWGLGFVADVHRMNVALTRAKHGLVVFGHENMGILPKEMTAGTTGHHGYKHWTNLVAHCRRKGCLLSIPSTSDRAVRDMQLNLARDWKEHGEAKDAWAAF